MLELWNTKTFPPGIERWKELKYQLEGHNISLDFVLNNTTLVLKWNLNSVSMGSFVSEIKYKERRCVFGILECDFKSWTNNKYEYQLEGHNISLDFVLNNTTLVLKWNLNSVSMGSFVCEIKYKERRCVFGILECDFKSWTNNKYEDQCKIQMSK